MRQSYGGNSESIWIHVAGKYTHTADIARHDSDIEVYCQSKAVDEEQAIGYVSVKLVDRIVDIMKVFLATLFLGGAIIGLYFVKSNKIRLGIIPPLVGLFALCLTFSTTATKGEIYGVSAAYVPEL